MKACLTPQQLDPLGTYSVWLLPAIAGAIAIAYTVAATIWHSKQIADPLLAALAVALVVLSCTAFTWASVPRRAPLGGAMFVAILVLAVLGSLSFTAATWGQNHVVQDDPGQVVTGVLLLAASQLRPARELVVAAVAVAGVLGLAAAAQAGFLAISVSPIVYGVVVATPPIVLAFGSAAYARAMVKATDRWQDRARAGAEKLEPQVRESVARSVQQEFVTVLNRQAVPLLEQILASGEITTADSDAATAIARQLRLQTVHALETSWLDDSLSRAGLAGADVVVDAGGNRQAVEAVTPDQRAVLGALLMALAHSPGWMVSSLRVNVTSGGRLSPRGTRAAYRDARLTVVAQIEAESSRRRVRRELAPFLSVLRATSADAKLSIVNNQVELGFAYDLA